MGRLSSVPQVSGSFCHAPRPRPFRPTRSKVSSTSRPLSPIPLPPIGADAIEPGPCCRQEGNDRQTGLLEVQTRCGKREKTRRRTGPSRYRSLPSMSVQQQYVNFPLCLPPALGLAGANHLPKSTLLGCHSTIVCKAVPFCRLCISYCTCVVNRKKQGTAPEIIT